MYVFWLWHNVSALRRLTSAKDLPFEPITRTHVIPLIYFLLWKLFWYSESLIQQCTDAPPCFDQFIHVLDFNVVFCTIMYICPVFFWCVFFADKVAHHAMLCNLCDHRGFDVRIPVFCSTACEGVSRGTWWVFWWEEEWGVLGSAEFRHNSIRTSSQTWQVCAHECAIIVLRAEWKDLHIVCSKLALKGQRAFEAKADSRLTLLEIWPTCGSITISSLSTLGYSLVTYKAPRALSFSQLVLCNNQCEAA